MRMVDRVHSNTTSTRPAKRRLVDNTYIKRIHEHVTLSLELVECATGLEQRLINTPTASDDADRCTRGTGDGLLRTAWEADTGFVVVGRVADDSSVVAGCPCECATVTDFLFNIADDCTFRQLAHGEDVADGELCLFAAVDEGAGVQPFGGDECFFALFVLIRVTEHDAGKGCATVTILAYIQRFWGRLTGRDRG